MSARSGISLVARALRSPGPSAAVAARQSLDTGFGEESRVPREARSVPPILAPEDDACALKRDRDDAETAVVEPVAGRRDRTVDTTLAKSPAVADEPVVDVRVGLLPLVAPEHAAGELHCECLRAVDRDFVADGDPVEAI
jgi:hypothetical protein